jgi:hypothetical protein
VNAIRVHLVKRDPGEMVDIVVSTEEGMVLDEFSIDSSIKAETEDLGDELIGFLNQNRTVYTTSKDYVNKVLTDER